MNLSSAIIKVKGEHAQQLMSELTQSGLCECHIYENGKLIITIEGKDTGEEMDKFNMIKQFENVITADLVFAYSEDELNKAFTELENQENIPAWLNDESIDATEIKYAGNVGR